MEFPYIEKIHVNNCYTYQNFDIPKEPLKELRHILLTGKNGSGKTTILNAISFLLEQLKRKNGRNWIINVLKDRIASNPDHGYLPMWRNQLEMSSQVEISFMGGSSGEEVLRNTEFIFSFFRAHRKVELGEVKTVTSEATLIEQLGKENDAEKFAAQFKQFLVNKKVQEAFDFMKHGTTNSQNQSFFRGLTETFKRIFGEPSLEMEFVQESFEFFLIFPDGRRVTFNQLSAGFSAFISILMDLFMRVDILRKSKDDYSLDPFGIVVIDEPETHFHLSMQYEILPLLVQLFPNIQFVVATHSPAVISSIKEAIVFDISTQSEVAGWQVGSSYSELMIRHFGLDNEFSPVADQIIDQVDKAVRNNDAGSLKRILQENEKYLTTSLRMEIESRIIILESTKQQA